MNAVRQLQERAARALPAERVVDAAGWWLRHAPRCSWWVGTALPHGETGADELASRVAAVEDFYAGNGATTRFQVSPGACPAGLDALLAERGYRRESPMSLRAAEIGAVLDQPAGAVRVQLSERPTRRWFEVWHAVHGHGDPRAEWDLLGRVTLPSAFASALVGEDVVAVGRAVVDTGWAGVFGMATLPPARGKGAARAVLVALARWAAANSAGGMYLQVERDNVAALGLYGRAGFGEVCGYHYRTAS